MNIKWKVFKLWYIVCSIIFTLESCDNKKLTILGEDSSNLHALEAIKDSFKYENGIQLTFRPNTFEDALEKANQDFKNHTGLYDIVMQYNFSLSSYVCNDYVWSIEELVRESGISNDDITFEDDFFKNAWEEVGFYYKNPSNPDAKQIEKVGYPFATNTLLLVYNKRMFEDPDNKRSFSLKFKRELTVPTDWEQYKQVAEFFTDKEKKTYGVCMQGAVGGWLYYEYCVFLYGMGGAIFDKKYGWEGGKDVEITINSPKAIEATKFYLSFRKLNKGNFFTVDATEQVKKILEGDVSMGLVWSDYLFDFLSDGEDTFGFAPIPGDKSPIAGGCFYVNRYTKYPQEAFNYILQIMKPETQVKLALRGLCSPFKSTYENPEVKKRIPYALALSQSLERGTYMFEAGRESDRVNNIITTQIQKLWRNEKYNVDDALKQIQNDIEDVRNELYK